MKPRLKLVLTNEDHVGPHHNIQINIPDAEVCEEDEAAILMPVSEDTVAQKAAVRLSCLNCQCVLLVGEDFEFEEVEVESWR